MTFLKNSATQDPDLLVPGETATFHWDVDPVHQLEMADWECQIAFVKFSYTTDLPPTPDQLAAAPVFYTHTQPCTEEARFTWVIDHGVESTTKVGVKMNYWAPGSSVIHTVDCEFTSFSIVTRSSSLYTVNAYNLLPDTLGNDGALNSAHAAVQFLATFTCEDDFDQINFYSRITPHRLSAPNPTPSEEEYTSSTQLYTTQWIKMELISSEQQCSGVVEGECCPLDVVFQRSLVEIHHLPITSTSSSNLILRFDYSSTKKGMVLATMKTDWDFTYDNINHYRIATRMQHFGTSPSNQVSSQINSEGALAPGQELTLHYKHDQSMWAGISSYYAVISMIVLPEATVALKKPTIPEINQGQVIYSSPTFIVRPVAQGGNPATNSDSYTLTIPSNVPFADGIVFQLETFTLDSMLVRDDVHTSHTFNHVVESSTPSPHQITQIFDHVVENNSIGSTPGSHTVFEDETTPSTTIHTLKIVKYEWIVKEAGSCEDYTSGDDENGAERSNNDDEQGTNGDETPTFNCKSTSFEVEIVSCQATEPQVNGINGPRDASVCYTGTKPNVTTAVVECHATNPCQNEGTCNVADDLVEKCTCSWEYEGDVCQDKVDRNDSLQPFGIVFILLVVLLHCIIF